MIVEDYSGTVLAFGREIPVAYIDGDLVIKELEKHEADAIVAALEDAETPTPVLTLKGPTPE